MTAQLLISNLAPGAQDVLLLVQDDGGATREPPVRVPVGASVIALVYENQTLRFTVAPPLALAPAVFPAPMPEADVQAVVDAIPPTLVVESAPDPAPALEPAPADPAPAAAPDPAPIDPAPVDAAPIVDMS